MLSIWVFFTFGLLGLLGFLWYEWQNVFSHRPRHFTSTPDTHDFSTTNQTIAEHARRSGVMVRCPFQQRDGVSPADKHRDNMRRHRVAHPVLKVNDPRTLEENTQQRELPFDGLYLSFVDFLRGGLFYGIPMVVCFNLGILQYLWRRWLQTGCLSKTASLSTSQPVNQLTSQPTNQPTCQPTSHRPVNQPTCQPTNQPSQPTHHSPDQTTIRSETRDPREVAASFCLESNLVMNYHQTGLVENTVVATFLWTQPGLIDDSTGMFRVGELLAVDVDLKTRRVVRAKLDGELVDLSADLLPLLFFVGIQGHIKLHGFANWATNTEHKDKEIRSASVANVYLNYLGDVAQRPLMKLWTKLGIISFDLATVFAALCKHVEKQGVYFHGNVRELMGHSPMAKFLVTLRPYFMRTFAKYKHEMAGIDGEALFVSSIVHSLDHHLVFCCHIKDPLAFTGRRFQRIAQYARVVSAGSIATAGSSTIYPAFVFPLYRDAKHPFFRKIYERSKILNPEFADLIQINMVT